MLSERLSSGGTDFLKMDYCLIDGFSPEPIRSPFPETRPRLPERERSPVRLGATRGDSSR